MATALEVVKNSSPSRASSTAPPRRPSQPGRRMLKTREAADYLGISTWTLRRLMNEGEIAYLKYRGGAANFDTRDLDAYIERKKVG
jgi:excisionase family DNA binding protein